MAEIGKALTGYVVGVIVLAFALFASAERIANDGTSDDFESGLFKLLLHKAKMHYQHFWPDLEFGWRVIVGSDIGFFTVVFGSFGDDRGNVTSTRSFFKGVEEWKEENRMHKYWNIEPYEEEEDENEGETATDAGAEDIMYKLLPRGPRIRNEETYTSTCSTTYWILNLLQVPVAVGVCAYEAVCLYNGMRVVMSSGKDVITVYMGKGVIMSSGEEVITWKVRPLILYCCCGFLAWWSARSSWRIHFGSIVSTSRDFA